MALEIRPAVVLESGDRLTRAEFHRRYCARPDIKKAELVEGVVYVASPLRTDVHGIPTGLIGMWLGVYASTVPGLYYSDGGTVYLDAGNEVQPDAFLCFEPYNGRGARLRDDGYVEGAPELVVEVAASSVAYDLYDKLNAYRRNGVKEYIIWLTVDRELRWLRLHEGEYVRVLPDDEGIIESSVFPGLRLWVPALLDGDAAGVLAPLRSQREEGRHGS